MSSILVESFLVLVILLRGAAEKTRRRVTLLEMRNSLAKDGAVSVLRVNGERKANSAKRGITDTSVFQEIVKPPAIDISLIMREDSKGNKTGRFARF